MSPRPARASSCSCCMSSIWRTTCFVLRRVRRRSTKAMRPAFSWFCQRRPQALQSSSTPTTASQPRIVCVLGLGNGRLLFFFWLFVGKEIVYFVLATLQLGVPARATQAGILPVKEPGGDAIGEREDEEQGGCALLAAQGEHDGDYEAGDGG